MRCCQSNATSAATARLGTARLGLCPLPALTLPLPSGCPRQRRQGCFRVLPASLWTRKRLLTARRLVLSAAAAAAAAAVAGAAAATAASHAAETRLPPRLATRHRPRHCAAALQVSCSSMLLPAAVRSAAARQLVGCPSAILAVGQGHTTLPGATPLAAQAGCEGPSGNQPAAAAAGCSSAAAMATAPAAARPACLGAVAVAALRNPLPPCCRQAKLRLVDRMCCVKTACFVSSNALGIIRQPKRLPPSSITYGESPLRVT